MNHNGERVLPSMARDPVYGRAYYLAHKSDYLRWGREWRLANPERARELAARQRATHRESRIAYMREWRLAHPYPRVRRIGSDPEKVKAWSASRSANRRARKLAAEGRYSPQEWLDKCALLGNVCVYCGEAKRLEADHKVPISRGGSNDITNIVPACRSCNARKSTKTAREFLGLVAA